MLYSCCKSLSLLEIYNNNFWTEGLSRETLRLMENESYKTETPPSNWRFRRVGWKKISRGLCRCALSQSEFFTRIGAPAAKSSCANLER